MTDKNIKRAEVIAAIQQAFHGVILGNGISLRQANVDTSDLAHFTPKEFQDLSTNEVKNNWRLIPLSELEVESLAHLDPEGFRYYIPAFMVSILEKYDDSFRVTSLLNILYPKKDSWEFHMILYSLLTENQKSSVALFLSSLPELADLWGENEKVVTRALKNYWIQFL